MAIRSKVTPRDPDSGPSFPYLGLYVGHPERAVQKDMQFVVLFFSQTSGMVVQVAEKATWRLLQQHDAWHPASFVPFQGAVTLENC